MTRHGATGQDTPRQDMPDMTWRHVLTANCNRSPISNARTIHTLPVNTLMATPSRRRTGGISNAHPPSVAIPTGGRPRVTIRHRRAHPPPGDFGVPITVGERPGITRAHPPRGHSGVPNTASARRLWSANPNSSAHPPPRYYRYYQRH